MLPVKIAPSLLSANFAHLGEEVEALSSAGADVLHFDVMDNHFVPNLTLGPMVCKALRSYTNSPIDVHLMVTHPDRLIVEFAEAGANWISIHPETCAHLDRSLSLIQQAGCLAGAALNPATPLACLDYVLDRLDFVLIMSVNPGFGGQRYLTTITQKLQDCSKKLALYQQATGKSLFLEVDGGINPETICYAAQAGADTFVAGQSILYNKEYAKNISLLREKAESARNNSPKTLQK